MVARICLFAKAWGATESAPQILSTSLPNEFRQRSLHYNSAPRGLPDCAASRPQCEHLETSECEAVRTSATAPSDIDSSRVTYSCLAFCAPLTNGLRLTHTAHFELSVPCVINSNRDSLFDSRKSRLNHWRILNLNLGFQSGMNEFTEVVLISRAGICPNLCRGQR